MKRCRDAKCLPNKDHGALMAHELRVMSRTLMIKSSLTSDRVSESSNELITSSEL